MKTKFKARIEITKESGEIIAVENCLSELSAQQLFDELDAIKYPNTFKGLTMNLSEYEANNIGTVRLIAIVNNNEYERRELFRKP
jgi:hypothetical protein